MGKQLVIIIFERALEKEQFKDKLQSSDIIEYGQDWLKCYIDSDIDIEVKKGLEAVFHCSITSGY